MKIVDLILDKSLTLYEEIKAEPSFSKNDLKDFIVMLHKLLVFCSIRFKNEAFEEENEWRVFVMLDPDEHDKEVQFRISGDLVVPIMDVEFKRKEGIIQLPIKSVILGPNVPADPGVKFVEMLLRCRGYPDVTVDRSRIPLRSVR